MKTFLLIGALAALANVGYAQAIKSDPALVAQDLATRRAIMDAANTFAKGNNVAAAEQALIPLNRTKPNTAAWHMETSQRLMQTAERLAREGQPASVSTLAATALSHLNQAETLTQDARTRASAKTLAGFIHERYLGDLKSALASYQAAVQLAPAFTHRAKESADRLQSRADSPRNNPPTGNE